MSGKKSTDLEISLKVNQILMLILRGIHRRADILRYTSKMDTMSLKEQKKRGWIPIEKCERVMMTQAKPILRRLSFGFGKPILIKVLSNL